jgi:hypothetical protein
VFDDLGVCFTPQSERSVCKPAYSILGIEQLNGVILRVNASTLALDDCRGGKLVYRIMSAL